MKKHINSILALLLLFTMTACNEGSKEVKATNSFKVSVTVPQEKSAVNSKFFKTSGDIVSILLVVRENNGAEESHAMSYDSPTDTWSVDFALSLANGPFTFRADAYDVSSPSLEGGDIPIFTGNVSFDPELDTETSVNIPLAETEVNVNTRVLPSLTSVEELEFAYPGTRLYQFNVVNKQGGVLNYYVDSVDENGASCTYPFFSYVDTAITSIDFESVSGDSSSFNLFYTSQELCTNPVHTLTLRVEATGDSINIPIVIDDESFNVTIALSPVIENIEVTQLEDGYGLEVKVENSENLDLSYEWSLAKGDGTLFSNTPEIVAVSNYNENIGLEVKVKVINNASGASSSFVYVVLEKVLVKNDDETVFDETTGLTWAKDTDVSGLLSWYPSRAYCESLNTNDPLYDWRRPTIAELEDVYPNDIFSNSQFLWSVNNVEANKELATDDDINLAWFIYGNSGVVDFSGGSANVRCVSGTSATSSNVQSKVKKTGQTKSYDENGAEVDNSLLAENEKIKDDGFYQKGITSSYTRNANNTVTDNVTGLVWQDDVDAKTVQLNWEGAKAYCVNKSTPIGTGWRLPSRKELQGLAYFGNYDPAISSKFQNTSTEYYYWTITTAANLVTNAWRINIKVGGQSLHGKILNSAVRCVR